MQELVLVALIAAVIVLWQKIGTLRGRIELLETVGARPAWPEPVPERKRPSPRPMEKIAAPSAPIAEQPEPPVSPPTPVEPPLPAWPDEPPRVRPGFEEVFGRRLPIWAGGVTLAVAGALIVRFSIDAGLLPPIVRVLSGLLFGVLLVGVAEVAHRQTNRVRDPRVAQALSGAGIASLYASTLIAANLYHLIGPLSAFLGMATITAAAMALALRFGAPSALLGLIGGLAAPALVGGGPANIPLLATYLALVVSALCALSRRQRWVWLGIAALVGGFSWGGVLIVGGLLDGVATISVGLYVLLLGLILPLLTMSGLRDTQIRIASSLLAALEIAALIATGGFAMLNWGLFGLVSIGIVWLARRDTKLADLPALGLAIVLPLIAAWPSPNAGAYAAVMIATVLIYGGPALARLWRGGGAMSGAGQIVAIGFAGLILSLIHFHTIGDGRDMLFGGLALLCAALLGVAAMLGWHEGARHADTRFALLATSSAFLIGGGAVLAMPVWGVPTAVTAIGLGLLVLGATARDPRLEPGAWTLAGLSVLLLALDSRTAEEVAHAAGLTSSPSTLAMALARWAGLSAMLAACAWKGRSPAARAVAQVLAVLAGYVAIAQAVPFAPLPLLPAIGLVAFAIWSRSLSENRLLPAATTCAGLAMLWALEPLAVWAASAMRSLVGMPILEPTLPALADVVLKLLVPSVAIVAAVRIARTGRELGITATLLASVLGGVALHSLYSHAFGLASQADFIRLGLAERTVWEALLLGTAILLWQIRQRGTCLAPIAISLGIAAFAHGIWYSILLHNPLWTNQATGSLPIVNDLLPAYAVPLLALWLGGHAMPEIAARHDRARSIAQMVLILFLGFSELRQLIHGAMLAVPGVTASETVLRSVGAIAIAIGFLLWGISRASQEWRIGSLVLMLAAVGKVFLIDAAGLDGLLRIASFVALGISLIGIGWLYSRFLKVDPALTAHQ